MHSFIHSTLGAAPAIGHWASHVLDTAVCVRVLCLFMFSALDTVVVYSLQETLPVVVVTNVSVSPALPWRSLCAVEVPSLSRSPDPVGGVRHPQPHRGQQPEPGSDRQAGGPGPGRRLSAEEDGVRS